MVRKKIIFFVISSMNYGGAETTLLKIITGINLDYFQPYLITFRKPNKVTWLKEYFKLEDLGIKVVSFNLPYAFMAVFHLAYFINKVKPQIVFSTLIFANFVSILANFISFKASLNVIREDTIRSIDIKGKNSYRWMAKFNYKFTSYIFTLSHASKDDIVKTFNVAPEKIKVVHNSFDFNYKQDLVFNKKFKEQFHSKKVLICVGRFYKMKNQLFLLKSFKLLVDRDIKFCLLLLGTGKQYLKECEKYVETNHLGKNVFFLGVKSNVMNYIEQSDMLICPSVYEGFGRVLIEALICKTKVLAKLNPGSNEVLNSGKYGWIIDTDDENEFAEAILSACDFEIPSDVETWLQQFNSETIMKEYNDFFLSHE